MTPPKTENEPVIHVPTGNVWHSAWKYTAILAAVGILLSVVGAMNDPRRFAYSWLFAFAVFLTTALGSLFFVMIQHLTVAGWSVTVRRTAEVFAMGIVALAVLFLPLLVVKDHLYGEWMEHGAHHGEEAEHHAASGGGAALVGPSKAFAQPGHGHERGGDPHRDQEHGATTQKMPKEGADGEAAHGKHGEAAAHGEHHDPAHALHSQLLSHKQGYLNVPFWLIRAFAYFAIWILLAFFYLRTSLRQDVSDNPARETNRMQGFAPIALMLFGGSLTFAAFDWLMSLEAAWYSTIFGVCVFAGAAVTAHALLIVMSLALKREGLLGDLVNREHLHDLGKLTFGFMVFWAYVSFSQLMLIWYAGIPEEAVYYHLRWGEHGWTTVSVLLLLGHFIVPFFFLLSRNVKRQAGLIGFGAAWLLLMHVLDMYWYVLPHYSKGSLVGSWIDVAALLAVGGCYLSFVFYFLRRVPLVPTRDPRLPRAVHFSNA